MKRINLQRIQKFLLLCALVFSTAAQAMRIGDITVQSAVGERFFAIVPISDTRRVRAEQILVSLAPRSVYQRMGVDWEYFHTGLIFDVIEDEREGIYLRIVSKDVVFEPFIDFVISFRWPSGFISRQFTVLLDMPLSSAAPASRNSNRANTASSSANRNSGSVVRETPDLSRVEPRVDGSNRISNSTGRNANRQQRGDDARTSRPVDSGAGVERITVVDEVSEASYLGGESAARQAEQLAKAQLAAQRRAEEEAAARQRAETKAREEARARAEAEREARARAEAQRQAREEAERRAQAEAEARLQAEQAARAREVAAAEARARAEREATARAEADKRARQEARALNVAEQQAQASAQAQQKAEAEAAARARAEAEARATAKAAERARLAAEAKARAEAEARAQQAQRARAAREARALAESQTAQNEPIDVSSQAEPSQQAAPAKPSTAVAPEPAQRSATGQASWDHVSRSGDTLWAIARKIQRESGGRIVDIVKALHRNNSSAFIKNDANRLRVDAQLNVSLAQIKTSTPASRRDRYWPDAGISSLADAGSAAAADTAKAGASESATPAGDAGNLERSETGQADELAKQAELQDKQQGVLSLVTRAADSTDMSPLTRDLSRELEQNSAEVEKQINSGVSRANSVETRMDNILAQYDALSEKTAQLKELEATLNRRIAEKAQLDLGLSGLPAPAAVPKAPNQGLLPDQQRGLGWWLQWLLLFVLLSAMVIAGTVLLRKRHEQRRNAYVDSWDNNPLRGDEQFSDDELAEMVKLKGEALSGPDDVDQF
ncbi:MAG: hypothetical protein HKO06_04960, partial [Pseudomonadales bacterium]|nr:hypothetical protein [Pseudomonadales bacterium]